MHRDSHDSICIVILMILYVLWFSWFYNHCDSILSIQKYFIVTWCSKHIAAKRPERDKRKWVFINHGNKSIDNMFAHYLKRSRTSYRMKNTRVLAQVQPNSTSYRNLTTKKLSKIVLRYVTILIFDLIFLYYLYTLTHFFSCNSHTCCLSQYNL